MSLEIALAQGLPRSEKMYVAPYVTLKADLYLFLLQGLALLFNRFYNTWNMLKKFLMKKMMKSQLKNVPEDQQEKILKAVEENPDLFQNIGLEIQAKMKEGKDQMSATMEVIHNHQEELLKIM